MSQPEVSRQVKAAQSKQSITHKPQEITTDQKEKTKKKQPNQKFNATQKNCTI